MNLRPLGSKVLLTALETNKTADGIIIPDTIHEKPMYFSVDAIGQGWYAENGELIAITNIKIGDTVLLQKHAGIDVKNEETGKSVRIASISDILAVCE